MKKVLAVLAIVAMLITIGTTVLVAKDYEKYLECKEKCSLFHDYGSDEYYHCMNVCFDGLPDPN